MNICVFAASSQRLQDSYYQVAYDLGTALGKAGLGLVFGGGRSGLMGSCARGVKEQGGTVIGVIPKRLNQPGIPFEACDELIETQTMHERKATMERLSNGFIVLPGGFGTLEELLEVLTLKQLGYHSLPIVLLNHNGFFDTLLRCFFEVTENGFANKAYLQLYELATTAEEAVRLICRKDGAVVSDAVKEAQQSELRC